MTGTLMMAGVGVGVAPCCRCGRRGTTTGVGVGLAFVRGRRVCAPAAVSNESANDPSNATNKNLLAASGNRDTVMTPPYRRVKGKG
jgi:recombinational DNA repair protein (RecF pathway)